MQNLNPNRNLLLLILCFFGNACATTSKYRVYSQKGSLVQLLITSDRVLIQCDDVQDPEEKPEEGGRYGLMMHVLDEANTVQTIIQTNVLDRKTCFEKKTDAEKILATSNQVYIAAYGDLLEPRTTEKWAYEFPRHGKFHSNGRSLTYFIFKGKDGFCLTAHEGSGKPCPEVEEFPLKNQPF